jgi:hypothetical protein
LWPTDSISVGFRAAWDSRLETAWFVSPWQQTSSTSTLSVQHTGQRAMITRSGRLNQSSRCVKSIRYSRATTCRAVSSQGLVRRRTREHMDTRRVSWASLSESRDVPRCNARYSIARPLMLLLNLGHGPATESRRFAARRRRRKDRWPAKSWRSAREADRRVWRLRGSSLSMSTSMTARRISAGRSEYAAMARADLRGRVQIGEPEAERRGKLSFVSFS